MPIKSPMPQACLFFIMTNKQSVFNVREIPTLDLDLGCIVKILNGDANQVKVTIEASEDDLKDFEVSQSGNTVSVRQNGASSGGGGMTIIGGNISIGNIRQSVVGGRGMSVVQSGGTTIITGGSGRVVFNGQEINLSGGNVSGSDYVAPKVTIFAPKANLEAKFSGVGTLQSEIQLQDTYLNCQGSVEISLNTQSLESQLSGSAEVKAHLSGGNLDLTCSGSADIDVTGVWSQARITASGSADINTNGTCEGNYNVTASGSADVRHFGRIGGRVRKSSNDCADIHVG